MTTRGKGGRSAMKHRGTKEGIKKSVREGKIRGREKTMRERQVGGRDETKTGKENNVCCSRGKKMNNIEQWKG